ncbi:ADP-ribosylation factor GTPase-activating protein AGD4-like protein isoform X1 [Tanacetum coccineum]
MIKKLAAQIANKKQCFPKVTNESIMFGERNEQNVSKFALFLLLNCKGIRCPFYCNGGGPMYNVLGDCDQCRCKKAIRYEDMSNTFLVDRPAFSSDSGCSRTKGRALHVKNDPDVQVISYNAAGMLLSFVPDLDVMLELLLEFEADINTSDYHGRTPLCHCIFIRNNKLAKYMLRRGAIGSITDDELPLLLSEGK